MDVERANEEGGAHARSTCKEVHERMLRVERMHVQVHVDGDKAGAHGGV